MLELEHDDAHLMWFLVTSVFRFQNIAAADFSDEVQTYKTKYQRRCNISYTVPEHQTMWLKATACVRLLIRGTLWKFWAAQDSFCGRKSSSLSSLNVKAAAWCERCWASACVVLQEFAGEDTTDLFLEERETALRQAQEEKHKLQMSVPGILNPHELPEEMCDWSSSGREQHVQNSSEGGKGQERARTLPVDKLFSFLVCLCESVCVFEKRMRGQRKDPSTRLYVDQINVNM